MYSRLCESAVIGILAGGWASCTYWEGVSGIFMGVLAFGASMFWLTIRDEEKGTQEPTTKHASPYKGKARLAGTRRA